jgi:predicted O-methyltransferase YrrM
MRTDASIEQHLAGSGLLRHPPIPRAVEKGVYRAWRICYSAAGWRAVFLDLCCVLAARKLTRSVGSETTSCRDAQTMTRILQNVARIPARTLASIKRRRNPAYKLQLEADRFVYSWLSSERIREIESIPGDSSNREDRLLAHFVASAPEGGCVVEIGAFCGKSTAWLVEAANRRNPPLTVVSIDPHQNGSWESFCATVSRFQLERRALEVRRAMSHDVGKEWNRPISFLWIDGSHEYRDVLQDIEDFTPHVVAGGRVVFDDACNQRLPGVARAIAERMSPHPGFRPLGTIKNFAVFERTSPTALDGDVRCNPRAASA